MEELLLAVGGTARSPVPTPLLVGFAIFVVLGLIFIIVMKSRGK